MPIDNKTTIQLSQFDEQDVMGLIDLSASVKWDYSKSDVETILQSGKIFGHKNEEGTIVSSAAIIPYENEVAYLGMVIVHDRYRGMGLGNIVTKACKEYVSDKTTILLIATEQGQPLYEKLGFQAVDCVHKLIREESSSQTATVPDDHFTIEECTESDVEAIIQLDQAAFGGNRTQFLKNRMIQSDQCLLAKNKSGKILGFGLSIPGTTNRILGPIVAPSTEIALGFIDKLSENHKGKWRIDVPSGRDEFLFGLEHRGFVQVSQPPIMVANTDKMPKRNDMLFGIAAQAFG